MENVTIVESHGLAKRYGSGWPRPRLHCMTVHRGEVDGFLDPNGAGGFIQLVVCSLDC